MHRFLGVCVVAGLATAGPAQAQTAAAPQPPAAAQAPASPLTLQAALAQARSNSQQFYAAQPAASLATEDRKQAFGNLPPSLNGFTQFNGTRPHGTPSGVWVANDGPRVYNMWLTVHGEVFSPARWAEYRAASAAEAAARAKADVATRGLVSTVVQNFYMAVAAARKVASAQEGLREAQQFLDITQKQEAGGEVAHPAFVKAQIQVQLRENQAKIELSLAQRTLQSNVATFYREAQIAGDQVASLRQSLDLSAESLRLTLLRYQSGEVSVLEVVDAQTTLIQARNAYNDGLVRYRVALAALQTLTGTL